MNFRTTSASSRWSRRPTRERVAPLTFVRRITPILLVIAGLLTIWSAVTYTGLLDPIVLPTPTAVAKAFWFIITSEAFPNDLRITMTETLGGGLVGISIGIGIGCLVGTSTVGRAALQPLMVTLQAVPALVLAPLMLIWFGYGIASKVALVILATFFPVFVTTVQGIRSTPESYMKLMRSVQAMAPRAFVSVRLPYAAPHIFAGIQASIASAFSAAIVAEFVGATDGLGVQVLVYNETLQIPNVFGLVIVMIVIGMALYYLADLLDRRIVFWRGR